MNIIYIYIYIYTHTHIMTCRMIRYYICTTLGYYVDHVAQLLLRPQLVEEERLHGGQEDQDQRL